MNIDTFNTTKLKPVAAALITVMGASVIPVHASVLNFVDGPGAGNTLPFPSTINSTPFTTTPAFPPPNPRNSEFRMIDPTGTVGGGGQKSIIDGIGDESWTFDDGTGLLTGVGTAFPPNPGSNAPPSPVAPSLGTNPTFEQSAPFFGPAFNFLAPTTGSLAGTAYGTCSITSAIVGSASATDGFLTVKCPVLEAQWGGTYFPLGSKFGGVGITFTALLTGMVLDDVAAGGAGFASYGFIMTGEHTIDATEGEDPGAAGFGGWTPQWELRGSGQGPYIVATDPVAAAPGVLAATNAGTLLNNGRILKSELSDLLGIPADNGTVDFNNNGQLDNISDYCVGTCFDYTVTGLAAPGDSAIVTLPLAAAIPSNGLYRKYDGAAWVTFDTSSGDTVESAPGTPGDCTTPGTYTPGLTAGNFCVRLTIADGGPNDRDTQNSQVIDPGGVVAVTIVTPARVGQSIDDAEGCSISSKPVSPLDKSDWFIVAAFLAMLGLRRKFVK